MSSSRGFTLLEMLVATSVLAALIYVGSSAFSLFASRWGVREDRFQTAFETSRGALTLLEYLGSLYPLAVPDEAGLPRVYFEGSENGFLATRLVDQGDRIEEEVLRLSVSQARDGTFQLRLERAPLAGTGLTLTTQAIPFGPPLTLLSGVEDIRFRYFGWASARERSLSEEPGGESPQPRWRDQFNALNAELMPLALAIDLKEEGRGRTLLAPLPAIATSRLSAPEAGL